MGTVKFIGSTTADGKRARPWKVTNVHSIVMNPCFLEVHGGSDSCIEMGIYTFDNKNKIAKTVHLTGNGTYDIYGHVIIV